ncbi:hypothetical protein QA635_10965 [Bradyrhizobium brasilense]|uniref:hypothetical protein n=1 Tax=Bradyrhizobium brasilense TaxID=1419277 RepID=UPI0024B26A5F|nr:hypothetical protein [Bradyrhizobium australafricanum]WFU34878.1 hypothetical protein QA635_10965 [Bradyrhizobium australafricanum]
MPTKSIAEMSLQEWLERNGRFAIIGGDQIGRAVDTTQEFEGSLAGAVAHYLYIASKDVPDEDAGLFRAAALRLIGKPVDSAVLAAAGKRKSNDDPLYEHEHRPETDLMDLWFYHHRVEIEAAERAWDAKHKR